MKEIAIIGPTASGKSTLAIELAARFNASILSVDSLAIYKEVDIVSAKPTQQERAGIPHYGIDVCHVDEYFSVERFIDIYKEAKARCKEQGKSLIVVGGSSFYLKTLLQGLSPMPQIDEEVIKETQKMLQDIDSAYKFLRDLDSTFAAKITSKDRYRIQKGLQIYLATKMKPSDYFAAHPPQKITDLKIYEIAISRETLRQKIALRTKQMLRLGLIDEICYLEKRYTRAPNPMKAIGIKETLEYLDGKMKSLEELERQITLHTAQLAKRQQIFNKTQFKEKISLPLAQLQRELAKELEVKNR